MQSFDPSGHEPRPSPAGTAGPGPVPQLAGRRVNAPRTPPAPSVIAICGGKGGVGKSTIALNVAVGLAAGGSQVGLLDADIHAPDIPLMVGLKREASPKQWALTRRGGFGGTQLEPVERFGVKIMSSGFIFAEDHAVSWTSDLVEILVHQLIWSTTWGDIDFLVIDLPPATADITQIIMRLLPSSVAVLVVTPQDAAHLDAKKVLAALKAASVPLLGAVENMSGLACPCCDHRIEVFPSVAHERSVWAMGVPPLGSVPLEPASRTRSSVGTPVLVSQPTSPQATALRAVVTAVQARLDMPRGDHTKRS